MVAVHTGSGQVARAVVGSRAMESSTTDDDGAFRLPNVLSGPQTFIVAVDDVGEEYPVRVASDVTTDVGKLVFHVPPTSIRRSPGGGFGWQGEDQEEWAARHPASANR